MCMMAIIQIGSGGFGLPMYRLAVPTLLFGGVGQSGMGNYRGR